MKNTRPTPRSSCRAPRSRSCLTATIAHHHIPRRHFHHLPGVAVAAVAARSPHTSQTRRAIVASSPVAANTVRAAVHRIRARRRPTPLPAAPAHQASSTPATRHAVSFRSPNRLLVSVAVACPSLQHRRRVMSNVTTRARGVHARVDGDLIAIVWLVLYCCYRRCC